MDQQQEEQVKRCHHCGAYHSDKFNCARMPINRPSDTPVLAIQHGGDHYKKLKIQPVEYIHANGIGYFEGSAIKYLSRWKDKGGVTDLKKAIHFIELLIEFTEKNNDK